MGFYYFYRLSDESVRLEWWSIPCKLRSPPMSQYDSTDGRFWPKTEIRIAVALTVAALLVRSAGAALLVPLIVYINMAS